MKKTLQNKILLLIAGTALVLVLALTFLSLDAIGRAGDIAQTMSGSALERNTEQYLVRLNAENASRNGELLERTLNEASLLAELASQIFSDPARYLSLVAPGIEQTLVQRSEGHFTDSGEHYASGFSPVDAAPLAAVMQDWKLASLMDDVVQGVLQRNQSAAAAYVVTQHDVTRYYSDIRLEGLPPDFRITEYFLYADAVPARNPKRLTLWTEVYDDPAGQGLMVSAIAPVYVDDRFVAITGIDFRLDDLAKQIEQMSLSVSSYSFMTNSDGRAIAFPARAYEEILGRQAEDGEFGVDLTMVAGAYADVIRAMRVGKSGMAHVVNGDSGNFVAYAPIPGTSWSLGTVISSAAVYGDVAALRAMLVKDVSQLALTQFLPLSVAILVVVMSVALYVAIRLTAPLAQLTDAAKNIGERKWNTPLPPAGEDEVGQLSKTLGSVAGQLEALIGNLELRVRERTSELHDALDGLKRTTEEKDRMFEELRTAQRLESIGHLAAGVAHEINTPAQYIGDNLEFLRGAIKDQRRFLDACVETVDQLADPVRDDRVLSALRELREEVDLEFINEEVVAALESSRDGIHQISSIVRSMKDFSHPGDKGKQLVDINHTLESSVAVAKNEWKYVATIETDFERDLPHIQAHAIELKQVFC